MGRSCLAYLSSRSAGGPCQTDEELEERLRSNPLYSYAAQKWAFHIRSLTTSQLSDEVIQGFLADRAAWEEALQAAVGTSIIQSFPKKMMAAHFVNVRDGDGRAVLSYAAGAGDGQVVELLVAGLFVDVDARDYKSRTPLSHAAGNGHATVVSQLLERGASPNWKDLDDLPPLSHATRHNRSDVVRVLLESGQQSDLNSKPRRQSWNRDDNFDTPLSLALRVTRGLPNS